MCSATLQGHTGGVWCLEMKDDLIVSGSTDRSLRVWDAASGECKRVSYFCILVSSFNPLFRHCMGIVVQFDVWQ